MTALLQPRRRSLRRAAVAVVAGLGLATTMSCAPAAGPTSTGSSQVPSSSTPSSRAATSATGALDDRLLAAAWAGDVPTAKALIEAGADVNHLGPTTESAFHIAASEGHLELLDLTLAHGADVASLDSYRGTSLIRAAERGHALVVGRLLQTPMKVDHVNRLKYTALHEAVILGRSAPSYADTVRLLVSRGADVTLPAGEPGQAPLDAARDRGYAPVIATVEAAWQRKPFPRLRPRPRCVRPPVVTRTRRPSLCDREPTWRPGTVTAARR